MRSLPAPRRQPRRIMGRGTEGKRRPQSMTNDRERKEAPAGTVALVTGASRGVGRGIAIALLTAGFRVYGTGRSIDQADLPREIRRLRCDHLKDDETAAVFEVIRSECGGLGRRNATSATPSTASQKRRRTR